jgi:hypothetical protein
MLSVSVKSGRGAPRRAWADGSAIAPAAARRPMRPAAPRSPIKPRRQTSNIEFLRLGAKRDSDGRHDSSRGRRDTNAGEDRATPPARRSTHSARQPQAAQRIDARACCLEPGTHLAAPPLSNTRSAGCKASRDSCSRCRDSCTLAKVAPSARSAMITLAAARGLSHGQHLRSGWPV